MLSVLRKSSIAQGKKKQLLLLRANLMGLKLSLQLLNFVIWVDLWEAQLEQSLFKELMLI